MRYIIVNDEKTGFKSDRCNRNHRQSDLPTGSRHPFNSLKSLPMPHDSSMTTSKSDLKMIVISSPRSSTLSFVRQFARSCVTINGTAFNQLMVN